SAYRSNRRSKWARSRRGAYSEWRGRAAGRRVPLRRHRLVRWSSFQGHQVRRQVVDLFVGIGWKHVAVRLERIVNLDRGDIAVPADGALHAVGIGKGQNEIVDVNEAAFSLLTIGVRHSDGGGLDAETRAAASSATTAGHHEGVLQCLWVGDLGGE